MKYIAIFILSYLLISCGQRDRYGEYIIGDWVLVPDSTSEEYIRSPNFINSWGESYTFYQTGIVDIKIPKFEVIDSGGLGQRMIKYLGSETKYRINGDSLFTLNRRDSLWTYVKIIKLSNDTLMIDLGYEIQKFVRPSKSSSEVDKIILSTSGCYGSCPILNIIIESSGDVTFYGEKYIDKSGFYESKISKIKYEELLKNFQMADFQMSDSVFIGGWSDDEEITTTFIRGDTILKSISDYGKIGSPALVWAYIPLTYLYQSIDLKELKNERLPIYLSLHYFKFVKGRQICDLTKSESFALWNYLRKGQRTTQDFESTMNLGFARNYIWAPSQEEVDDPYNKENEKIIKQIQTDGRRFKFQLTNHEFMTIDIGFNFLENNKVHLRFRDKEEHED